jgi:hypothetical protein
MIYKVPISLAFVENSHLTILEVVIILFFIITFI